MSFTRYLSKKYEKKIIAWLDAPKIASKKVIHKVAEAISEFIGNKIMNKTVKPKPLPDENSMNTEEIIILLKKRQEILKELRQVLWNGISKNIIIWSNCVKVCRKKKVNDLLGA